MAFLLPDKQENQELEECLHWYVPKNMAPFRAAACRNFRLKAAIENLHSGSPCAKLATEFRDGQMEVFCNSPCRFGWAIANGRGAHLQGSTLPK